MSFDAVGEVLAAGYEGVAAQLDLCSMGEMNLAKLVELELLEVGELSLSEKASLLIRLSQGQLEGAHSLLAARGCLIFLRLLFQEVGELQ